METGSAARAYRAGLVLCVLGLAANAHAASFHGIGLLNNPGGTPGSAVFGISADGQYAVGLSSTSSEQGGSGTHGMLVRWSVGGGLENLGITGTGTSTPIRGPSISANGSTIVGSLANPPFMAFRLHNGQFQPFVNAGIPTGLTSSGDTFVGSRFNAAGPGIDRAGIYRASNGFAFEDLGFGPNDQDSYATGLTASGHAAAGFVERAGPGGLVHDVYRWQAGVGSQLIIANLSGSPFWFPTAISDDGDTIVGRGWRWTENSGFENLAGIIESHAVSADGSILAGERMGRAAMMNAQGEVRLVSDILTDDLGLNLTGWTLLRVSSMTPDGLVVGGEGIGPNGLRQVWVAYLPEPGSVAMLALFGLAALRPRR